MTVTDETQVPENQPMLRNAQYESAANAALIPPETNRAPITRPPNDVLMYDTDEEDET